MIIHLNIHVLTFLDTKYNFCKIFIFKKNGFLVLGAFGLPATNHTCVHDKFNCQDGTCIPINWRCDGEKDCKSELDEKGCGKGSFHNSLNKFV
jgi:hypothetical protein